jgi:tRNA pseudouridine38-40 synthase
MRVRATVEYLGTKWSGWQLQPGQPTLQGELERAIETFTRVPVRVHASGRTDAGVHATAQVIAFDVDDATDLARLALAINALTDRSVTIVDVARADDDFDPRRRAISRTYEYTIVNGRPPSPFLADRCWHVIAPLDIARLQTLATRIVGEHDFAAFRASDCESPSTVRRVSESAWSRDGVVLVYRVSANAFLKQMVRTLVGTMVDVAVGKLPEAAFDAMLAGGARKDGGRTAPAQGLCLVRVDYPD